MKSLGVAAVLVLLLAGCAGEGRGGADAASPGDPPEASAAAPEAPAAGIRSLPADAVSDYQLGGGYDPADGVTVVVRDSTDEPAAGLYSVCYVNGFQTQPGAEWDAGLLLQRDGTPLADPDWPDEYLLDIAGHPDEIADVVGSTIEGCAADGFAAVEFDNLDSYTRSEGALTESDALTFARLLVARAHAVGLAVGQKNTPQLGERGPGAGFDFVVAEECVAYDECGAYTDVYGDAVIAVEYFPFDCADAPRDALLRDRDLVPAGEPGYEFEHCAL